MDKDNKFDKYEKQGAYHWKLIDGSFQNRWKSRRYSLDLTLRYDKVVSSIQGKKKQVLEIGCGDGALAHLIARKGHRVTGLDLEEAAIRWAKEKIKNRSYEFTPKFYQEDVLHHDFKDCQYDYIVFADVIEHLPDPVSMIEKAIKLQKKGGEILITTPVRRGNYQSKFHVKEYTADELGTFLSRFSQRVIIKQFMPLRLNSFYKRQRGFFNLLDYAVNILKINSPFSDYCMILAVLRK